MTKVQITFEVAEESADDQDGTGLTEEAFDDLMEAVGAHGDDIDIVKVSD